MSIINKMLQDLDRRQGRSDPDATLAMSQVRTVPAARKDREWFWRIIAVLMIAAVGWVGWIAWQLQPRAPVVTEQAFKAAENAQKKSVAAVTVAPAASTAPVVPKRPEEKPATTSAVPAQAAAAQAAPDTLRLAKDIGTPIREQGSKPAAKEPAKTDAKPTRKEASTPREPAKPVPQVMAQADPKAAEAPTGKTPPVAIPRVEKRDRARGPEDRAEMEFRRGVSLLNQGRISEAEESLGAALHVYAGHEAARQALIALDLEQRRVDDARRLLQEGLALNPANARFASVLARILIERRDYAGALDAVNGALAQAQTDPELQMMRGTALQRLGRHAEASDAFRASLRAVPQNGAGWMALGISLEAQDKRREAAEAYKRAAAAGSLGPEARDYAEQRARALQ